MSDLILCTCRLIFIFYSKSVFVSVLCELVFINSNCRLTWIICRIICDLIGNRVAGCCDSIREVAFDNIKNLTSDFHPAVTIHVVIVDCEFVSLNIFEYRYSIKALTYSCTNFNWFMS